LDVKTAHSKCTGEDKKIKAAWKMDRTNTPCHVSELSCLNCVCQAKLKRAKRRKESVDEAQISNSQLDVFIFCILKNRSASLHLKFFRAFCPDEIRTEDRNDVFQKAGYLQMGKWENHEASKTSAKSMGNATAKALHDTRPGQGGRLGWGKVNPTLNRSLFFSKTSTGEMGSNNG